MKEYKKIHRWGFVFATCLCILIIFDRSLMFVTEQMSTRKLLVIGANIAVLVLVPVACAWIRVLGRMVDTWIQRCGQALQYLKSNGRRVLAGITSVLAIYAVAWLLEGALLSNILGQPVNVCRRWFLFAVGCMGFVIWRYRSCAGEKPQQLFAWLAFISGSLLILVMPATTGVSWDDETHYRRSIEMANVVDGSRLEAESRLLQDFPKVIENQYTYDRESRTAYYDRLNGLYEARLMAGPNRLQPGIWSLAYIPAAIGIILGQGLGLPFVQVFMCGKLFVLLAYILLFSCAIKKVSEGKILFAVFGLLPVNVFLASNYSYDFWVTGFIALAYAQFFYELQNPQKHLTRTSVAKMLGFLVLGCMPKAVYIVLGLPFLFMPKEKFASKKQRCLYYLPVIAGAALLVASFVLPVLLHGAGQGDTRGGNGVHADGQLANVLAHPFEYMETLVNFLKKYLSLKQVSESMTYLAYYGNGVFSGITFLTLFAVACLDKKNKNASYTAAKFMGVLGCLAAVCLCATAMYIAYTPVGASTIKGCQGRYLLPVVLPFLLCATPRRVHNHMDENWFAMVPMLVMTSTLMMSIYQMIILPY